MQQASAGFAAQRVMRAGQAAFVLLLMLPPFGDLAAGLVGEWAGVPVDRSVAVLAMTVGFCMLAALHAGALMALASSWWMARR